MLKKFLVAMIGILALLYLFNPGLGVFEIIPDNIPLIGNLDEVTATYLLLSALAFFGADFRGIFGKIGGFGKTKS
jgi:hypothetical protein